MYYSYVMGIDNRIMELASQGFDIQNDEVLDLCEKLCECKCESLRAMLVGNHFYKKALE